MSIGRRAFLAGSAALAAGSPFSVRAETALPEWRLVARPTAAAPKTPTSALAYEGLPADRVLRLKAGVEVPVALVNHLDEPTDLDWHGMRLPADLQVLPGIAGSPVPPQGEAVLKVRPREPGTAWLHPNYVPGRSDQTARGLAAAIVVEEPDAPQVDADLVLLVLDRPEIEGGPLEARLAVNGEAWPATRTVRPGARLRLRLVNGSTREALAATFAGAVPKVVAIDGQPSELFRPLNDTVPIGPGARFDILVDLPQEGGRFSLLLRGPAPISPSSAVFIARTEGSPVPERPPIHSLTQNPTLPAVIHLEKAKRIDLVATESPTSNSGGLVRWTVNGVSAIELPRTPLFTVKRNTPVTLGFGNRSARLVAYRLHGHVMRLLHSMDDGWEPYWRDSILVPPGATVHAAFLADMPGRWLIDSPFFDQAAGGLRTWFEVT